MSVARNSQQKGPFLDFLDTVPVLLPFAFASSAVFLISMFFVTQNTSLKTFAIPLAATLLVISHAAFLVVASRTLARRLNPDRVDALEMSGWARAVLGVAFSGSVIGIPCAFLLPNPGTTVLVVAAAFALTPLLPSLALQNDDGAVESLLWRNWRFILRAARASAPWFIVSAFMGLPTFAHDCECYGIMEGGIITLPMMAMYVFFACLAAAFGSTRAFMSPTTAQE